MSRAPGSLIVKDPQSIEPWGIDWTAYLAELGAGVTIATSTWLVSGPDGVLTIGSDSIVAGNLKTQAWLSGGTVGAQYTVTNRITATTVPAETDDRSFYVLVENR